MTTSNNAATQLDIAYLIAAFPQCFFLNHECRQPLKIGIVSDLAPLLPFTEAEIQAVLRSYTRSDGYLHACTEGAIRIDVNGDAAGHNYAASAAARRFRRDGRTRIAKLVSGSKNASSGAAAWKWLQTATRSSEDNERLGRLLRHTFSMKALAVRPCSVAARLSACQNSGSSRNEATRKSDTSKRRSP
jgi:sRNA-binding protein